MRVYMKTLTEFPGIALKNAAKLKSDLIAAGKTLEEIPQALGEALKLEGGRLGFLVTALEIIDIKLNDLKRAVVYSLAEGEKPNSGCIQKGEHAFFIEYFPPLEKKKPEGRFQEGRQDKDRKKRGKRGKGRGDRPQKNQNKTVSSPAPQLPVPRPTPHS